MRSPAQEASIREGRVAEALRREFPGLSLRYCEVDARPGRSPSGVRRRLRYMADRLHGQKALNMRREPIASAYRVFFRQIGLDPDELRPPAEAIVLERLRVGGFRSHGTVDDAVTIATVETGVAMRALDADRISGRLALRISQPRERLGGDPHGLELPDGTLVVADDACALGLIFGETAPDRMVRSETRRVVFCALAVDGVPPISVEEAIWTALSVVSADER
jgi:DNA/RNA-binding domain of Phe-tRNA-synthetase-like protein